MPKERPSPDPRRKRRRWILACAGALVALVAGELGVRLLGSYDLDGNFALRVPFGAGPLRLKPYRIPVREVRAKIDGYLATIDASLILYDEDVGWKPRRGAAPDGLFCFNEQSIRSAGPDDSIDPEEEAPRIGLFGDSFTQAGEVRFEQSWGHVLELGLRERGVPLRTLNFGVGGYGIDQAYLRWRTDGARFRPRLVICGFQPENVKRSLCTLWPLYRYPLAYPFAKPRFALEGAGLVLRNVPTPGLDRVPEILEDLDAWELRPLEHFYRPEDYRDRFLLRSKLFAVASRSLEMLAIPADEERFFAVSDEPARLALAILERFRAEVEAEGAAFWIVHLPRRYDLRMLSRGLAYAGLLDELKRRFDVIDPLPGLVHLAEAEGLDVVFAPLSHYSPRGNALVAQALLEDAGFTSAAAAAIQR